MVFHLHDDTSNCNGYADSCTSYGDYIKLAKKQNMKALAFSNHGGIYDWIKKKQDCDKAGIKYIHGVELYLVENLQDNERGYHIGLYSKNFEGVKELNSLMSLATSKGVRDDNSDRHSYYNPRISIEELMNTSQNIIITTACLASILWKKRDDIELINKLLTWMSKNNDRCFLEIQYHNHPDQIEYNKMIYEWSKTFKIPLIAGTDTHSSNNYKAECRKILQISKDSFYGDEDSFDLTWKTYDELVNSFAEQNSLPKDVFLEAISNTNKFSNMVDDFKLDYSFKYPTLYGDKATELWKETILAKYNKKIKERIIKDDNSLYMNKIKEEFEVMKKQGMESFMLFMSELVDYCNANGIPYGDCRGSVGGSTIAYITDITDVDPIIRNTVFSRFCNEDRISLADIDIDFAPEDRKKVYEYIIDRFTPKKTAYIAQFGTLKDRGTIDALAKGLEYSDLQQVKVIKNTYERIFSDYSTVIQEEVNLEDLKEELGIEGGIDLDNHDIYKERIRNKEAIDRIDSLLNEFNKLKKDNMDLFYYFDGIKGTIISKGNHPAGIIGSPITLPDSLGVFYKDGDINMPVAQCAMKAVDSVNYVKFDILGLKTVGILKDTYKYTKSHYLKSHEINWNDENVWNDMIKSNIGVFQFEGNYAHSLLKSFIPQTIDDMSLVNAALRPSGKSYRGQLINREFHKNPSEEIDELLKSNHGFLVFQEDTIKFLTDICGLSGSTADTTRRAIGKKDLKLLKEQLPKIVDGYCKMSKKPRDIAEKEVEEFIQIIDDSSEYQFGFNHSTGYSMIGYRATMQRAYYPLEFITAYLNRADNEEDIQMGTKLAEQRGIAIRPIKFRYSGADYRFDKKTNTIYKGIASIKFLSEQVSDELYELRNNRYESFYELLLDLKAKTSADARQTEILIKLDFFDEFGNSKKLLEYVSYFNSLYKSKVVNKSKFDDNINNIIKKHSRETDSQYRDLDNEKILNELWNSIPNEDLPILDKMNAQKEYLGYIDYSNPKLDKRYVMVTDLDTKFSPKFNGYCLNNGKIQELKIYKQKKGRGMDNVTYFKDKPFKDGDLLFIEKFNSKPKSMKTDDGWIAIPDTKEWWVTNYSVVDYNKLITKI